MGTETHGISGAEMGADTFYFGENIGFEPKLEVSVAPKSFGAAIYGNPEAFPHIRNSEFRLK